MRLTTHLIVIYSMAAICKIINKKTVKQKTSEERASSPLVIFDRKIVL